MESKCESCEECNAQCELKIKGSHLESTYKLCLNCLGELINLNLTKKQFKNLLKNGHNENEFYLHEDFYDCFGNALQPK